VRTALLLGLLTALTLSCSPLGDLGTLAPTDKAPYTLAPPTPTLSPIATVAPTGHGRPYTAEMIAAELLDVPDGFPPELQTEFIAAAIADRIWTYDGRPYREVWITGSCNEPVRTRCDLTLEGLPAFAPTRDDADSYWFVVHVDAPILGPESGQGLRGFPPDVAHAIDALARSLDTDGRFRAEALRGIDWALPPPDDAFVLTYGDDNEGDTMIFVTLDRANRQLLSIDTRVCCG
jgi:hypothetical protein